MLKMIPIENIDYAVVVNGKRYMVYKKKKYKPVDRFLSSSKAIQYARKNRYSFIISITKKKPSRWIIMEEVVFKK